MIDINEEIKQYFSIKELVPPDVYKIHGEGAWRFIDADLLRVLLVIREEIGRPITINNWAFGGGMTQRGLRHNLSPLTTRSGRVYLSAHIFGKAVDFNVKGMTACEVREWIEDNADLLPASVRLERNKGGEPISWVHLDVLTIGGEKFYLFDV